MNNVKEIIKLTTISKLFNWHTLNLSYTKVTDVSVEKLHNIDVIVFK